MSSPVARGGHATLDAITSAAAASHRDRPAIISEETWSFGRLDAEATSVARALGRLGVRRGDRVALRVPPCGRALVLLAAIARTGASAVPFDVATPTRRLIALSSDAAVRLTIDGSASLAMLFESDQSGASPEGARPQDEAYVIYTSGSTGIPKGVSVAHGAIAAHADHVRTYFGLTTADRVLQFASLGFDVSQEEVWPTWAAGAAVVVNPSPLPDAHRLAELTAAHGITVLQLPTAYWRTVITAPGAPADGAFPRVRILVVGGETVRGSDLAAHAASELRHAELINFYGPTETVVTSVAWRYPGDAGFADGRAIVPIGTAFPGRQTAVLRSDGALAGPGEQGELWVAGLLADGYVNQPDATSARFVTPGDDMPALAGRRWYLTGDQVLVLPDGLLAFAGRLDDQVKLRGYRIELGEIDEALRGTGLVTDAATALIESEGAHSRLGALVVPKDGFEADAVAAALRSRLPAAFVPALWAEASAIPLTSSGKVDRSACGHLIAAAMKADGSGADDMPLPVNHDAASMLDALADVWRAVLGVDEAEPGSDFFGLGGDSLLAVRFAARARANGIGVSPADVVRSGTLGGIATAARWQPGPPEQAAS